MMWEAVFIPLAFVIAACFVVIAAVHVAHLMRGKYIDDSDGDR